MRLLSLLATALLTLSGCATLAAPLPAWDGFYVMRHLHTPAGNRDPDLTAEGERQAALLPRFLQDAPPRAIYVSSYKRTAQTAAPVAARFGVTPIIYDPADTATLVALVRSGPRPALIVGHSNTVPDIVEQLGGTRPDALVHEDFGDVWLVGTDGQTRRLEISQARPAH